MTKIGLEHICGVCIHVPIVMNALSTKLLEQIATRSLQGFSINVKQFSVFLSNAVIHDPMWTAIDCNVYDVLWKYHRALLSYAWLCVRILYSFDISYWV